MSDPHVICSTPWQVTPAARAHAAELAAWFRCRMVERRDRSVARLLAEEDAEVLVVADTPPKLYHVRQPDRALFFHPGMAMQRIERMRAGWADRLVAAAHIQPGDVVVDATLGAGSDTLVLAEAVGPSGRVVSFEVSTVLADLFRYAQAQAFAPYAPLAGLAERIRVVAEDHRTGLKGLPNDSADVVYVDPMFRAVRVGRSANMDDLRPFTRTDALSAAAVAEARRVCRRAVVVKERPGSGVFERFGLRPDKPRARFAYGVWQKADEPTHPER
ncbi:MAG: class I SAM-dependent methyltransferase [Alicyclobacillus sp.]|nr:class I SAM-dependent methyltransferase [Alicyclobacillus sp.]